MARKLLSALALSAALSMFGLGAQAQPAPMTKNDYSKPEAWLCWPGKAGDACAIDNTTTVIKADGSMTTEPFKANPKAPIDCFYVYPTVSNDPGVLSDMHADKEELDVVKAQLARFGSKCRIYAPLYRQFTLTALRARMTGKPVDMTGVRPETTYEDVLTSSTTAGASCSSDTRRVRAC